MHAPLRLTGPVTAASILAPAPEFSYTEIDGRAVLGDLDRRVVHELSPVAAVIWSRIDGNRSIEEISASLDGDGKIDGDVIELVRRLRALGAVFDAEPGRRLPTSVTESTTTRTSAARVALRGSIGRPGDRSGSGSVVLATTFSAADADLVMIDIGDEHVLVGDVPVERFVVPCPEGAVPAGVPMPPFDALGNLLRAVDTSGSTAPMFDLLADLAERIPVVPAVERPRPDA